MSAAPAIPSDATARIAALEASLARANAALAARDLLIDTLRGQIARLRRMQFGASSEKLGREIAQLELALEDLETESAVPDVEAAAPNRPTRPAPVRALPDHLPREDVVHEPASGACICPVCGGTLRRMGADTHEMLDVMPVRWRALRNVRPKYSCRICEKIVQAPAPVSAVARGKATFATLAHVVVLTMERSHESAHIDGSRLRFGRADRPAAPRCLLRLPPRCRHLFHRQRRIPSAHSFLSEGARRLAPAPKTVQVMTTGQR